MNSLKNQVLVILTLCWVEISIEPTELSQTKEQTDTEDSDQHKCEILEALESFGNNSLCQNCNTAKILNHCVYLGDLDDMSLECINADTLKDYFDSCITEDVTDKRDKRDRRERVLKFDYSCFQPQKPATSEKTEFSNSSKLKAIKEMTPFEHIYETPSLNHLIEHPLILSFIFFKWFRLRFFFLLNFSLYSIHCISLFSYLTFFYGHDARTSGWTLLPESTTGLEWVLWCIALFTNVLLLIRELLQFLGSPVIYKESFFENMYEIYLALYVLLFMFYKIEDDTLRRTQVSVIILSSAAEWTFLLGKLPYLSLSTHLVMLRKVARNFMRIFFLYSIIFVAFAITFYTSFGSYGVHKPKKVNTTCSCDEKEVTINDFPTVWLALMKTSLMMVGEFDLSDIKFERSAFSYAPFVFFLILMTIVMMNLLNGLAVSDIQHIQKTAEWLNWRERVKLLVKYERIAKKSFNCYGKTFLRTIFRFESVSRRINLFPSFLEKSKIKMFIVKRKNTRIEIEMDRTVAFREFSVFRFFLKPFTYCSSTSTASVDNKNMVLERTFLYLISTDATLDRGIVENALAVIENKEKHLAKEKRHKVFELNKNYAKCKNCMSYYEYNAPDLCEVFVRPPLEESKN